MGADGARGGRTDGARGWRSDRTRRRVRDGLGRDVAVVVQFGRARRAGGQLWWFEGVDQVHVSEDGRRRDEIQLLSRVEHLHLCRVQISELRSG